MAIVSCIKKNNSINVTFGADTSVRNAKRIKSALIKIISIPVNSCHLDLSEIKESDITFIQLLIAFNEKLKKQNRQMFIVPPHAGSAFTLFSSECGVDINNLFEVMDG